MQPTKPINFAQASLKKRLFTWKQANPRIKSQNPVFQSLMANKKIKEALNQKSEQKAFFNAIREVGVKAKGKGINKKTFIEIIKKTAESGLINKKELRTMEKEMVGGDLARRFGSSDLLLRRKKSNQVPTAPTNVQMPNKQPVSMRQIYNGIMSSKTNVANSENVNKQSGSATNNYNPAFSNPAFNLRPSSPENARPEKVLEFATSNRNLRNAQELLSSQTQKNLRKSISVNDYIATHTDQKEESNEVKSLLDKIQGKADNYNNEGDQYHDAV